jgi:hypothetical protein
MRITAIPARPAPLARAKIVSLGVLLIRLSPDRIFRARNCAPTPAAFSL